MFFLGILILKRDTDVTHLLFVVISLVLMSHLMNLNLISLLRLLVTVLLVFLSYHMSPTKSPQKPLQVYCHRQKPPTQTSSPPSDPPLDLGSLPIALGKVKHSCTSHPISQFVSYGHLSSSLHAFTSSLNSTVVPKFVRRLCPSLVGSQLWRQTCLPCLKMLLGF